MYVTYDIGGEEGGWEGERRMDGMDGIDGTDGMTLGWVSDRTRDVHLIFWIGYQD